MIELYELIPCEWKGKKRSLRRYSFLVFACYLWHLLTRMFTKPQWTRKQNFVMIELGCFRSNFFSCCISFLYWCNPKLGFSRLRFVTSKYVVLLLYLNFLKVRHSSCKKWAPCISSYEMQGHKMSVQCI